MSKANNNITFGSITSPCPVYRIESGRHLAKILSPANGVKALNSAFLLDVIAAQQWTLGDPRVDQSAVRTPCHVRPLYAELHVGRT